MEIRVDADKSKAVKVKVQSDEVAVRIGKAVPSERLRSSVGRLKAHFEESVTALRHQRPPSFPSPLTGSATVLRPEKPSLDSFHPLLQTLLNLVWDSHMHHFHAVLSTFQQGVAMKVDNTRKLLEFRTQLRTSAKSITQSMTDRALSDIRTEFRTQWAEPLAHARHTLKAETSDVDELLELSLKMHGTLTPVDLHADVDRCLGVLRTIFKGRGDRLWEEWTLHMKRHQLVFKGNLSELEFVDSQIATLPKLQDISVPDQSTPSTVTDPSPFQDIILTLASIKLDFDIRLASVQKLKSWAQEKLEASCAQALTDAFASIVKSEDDHLNTVKLQLTRTLDEQKIVQDRVLRELRLACNNTLAPVDAILKSMQLSLDLALEAARESVYVGALQTLKSLTV